MFPMIKLTCSNGHVAVHGDASHQSGSSVPDERGLESGVFGSWNWDGSVFKLQTDRFGYLPFYYHHDSSDGTLRVSDSPQQIVADIPSFQFDAKALGFFCRSGFASLGTVEYSLRPSHSQGITRTVRGSALPDREASVAL